MILRNIIAQEGNWKVDVGYTVILVTHQCPKAPHKAQLYCPGHSRWPNDHKGCLKCKEPIPTAIEAMYHMARMCR